MKAENLTCDVCEHSFAFRFHVVTHNKIHTSLTPYKCDVCINRLLACPLWLNMAEPILHTNDLKYDVCDKTFALNVPTYVLLVYMQVVNHTQVACLKKTFAYSIILVKHARIYTNEKD
jgi:hypothetical protein